MYKLLTTAAVIMTVATPSIANDWTGAKDLVNNLKGIYTNLDGGNEFKQLEGDFSGNNGQLADFFSEVDKGVTYITLKVDGTTNKISTGINEGSTFAEITAKQNNLINRVNFDLFKQDDDGIAIYQTFDETETYTGTTGFAVPGSNEGTSQNEYSTDLENGLAGRKIVKLVDNVNDANDYLIAAGRSKSESQAVIDAFNGDGTGVFTDATDPDNILTADLTSIQGHITGLNAAIDIARDDNATTGTNSFFGNIGLGGFAEDGVNNFLIPAFNTPEDIGSPGIGGFTSISNWASDIQTVTVGDKTGTVNTAGTITVVDEAAGTISDGTTTFTWDADTSTFI